MKKRILSWGLMFSLLLTQLPVSAIAAEKRLVEGGQQAEEAAAETGTDTAHSSIYTVEDDTSTVILTLQSFPVHRWMRKPAATWC